MGESRMYFMVDLHLSFLVMKLFVEEVDLITEKWRLLEVV